MILEPAGQIKATFLARLSKKRSDGCILLDRLPQIAKMALPKHSKYFIFIFIEVFIEPAFFDFQPNVPAPV